MRLPADIYCKKRENKMITVSDLSFNFGTQTLFKGVDLKFTPGNCYGIIGANGADNSAFFNSDLNLIDWMRQYSKDQTETYIRGFLGRMLFSGDAVLKPVNVLSGGEKVRCMLSRMMLFGSNVLILDQPTNHLDLESITAVNNGLSDFKGNVLFCSHDYEIVNTVANRIIEICDDGVIDHSGNYDDFVEFKESRGMEVTTL